jgi:hypothetical protein
LFHAKLIPYQTSELSSQCRGQPTKEGHESPNELHKSRNVGPDFYECVTLISVCLHNGPHCTLLNSTQDGGEGGRSYIVHQSFSPSPSAPFFWCVFVEIFGECCVVCTACVWNVLLRAHVFPPPTLICSTEQAFRNYSQKVEF